MEFRTDLSHLSLSRLLYKVFGLFSVTVLYNVFYKVALLRFSRGKDKTKDEIALQDLVGMLLEPSPEQRLKNFESETESEMHMVLQHPFFDAKSLGDATLQAVSDQLTDAVGKLDVVIEMGLEHRIELQHTCKVTSARQSPHPHIWLFRGSPCLVP